MLEESDKSLFCNGYAVIEKNRNDLELIQKILNSEIMNYYVSMTSYSIEGNCKCYQKNMFKTFPYRNLV